MTILTNLLINPIFAKSISIILFQTMICYWIAIKYPKFPILKNLCWIGNITSNFFIFLILSLRWIISGYFPLSNLYESLLFLNWCLLFIIFVIEFKTQTKTLLKCYKAQSSELSQVFGFIFIFDANMLSIN